MKKQGGFTLLEIMLSLMIVGLIASVAGSAIVAGLNGYLAAKENQSLAQKSQLALLRLSRHLSEFVNIPSQSSNAKADSIIIESLSPTSSSTVRTFAIGLDGSQLKIAEDARNTTPDFHNGDVLVDGVSSFTLTYYRDGVPWQPASDPLQRLATIEIRLTFPQRPDNPFVTQVHPRNINSLGGQPTPVTPPDQANYASCFVATAAYGRADHPMVLLLREFRDRYLLTWDGGKALVRAYYSVGPVLASLIQGRPWACGIAQFVLLPFVVFAFFALYFPPGIPIVLCALWFWSRKSRHDVYCPKGVPAMLRDQRGAVLVAVVITMIIFATLGAMMLSFFTTSTFSQLGGSRGMRAFYLAESGFRYAASVYMNAADEATRQTALEGMHNDTFTLGTEGQFNLQVYPYWYQTTALPAGNNLEAKVFGGLPLDAAQYANGWIQIKKPDGNIQYEQIASVTLNPPSGITFTKTSAWQESYPVGCLIYPVTLGVNSSQTFNVNQYGSFISLQADSGYAMFPQRNGMFTVKEQGSDAVRTLSYDELFVDAGSGTYQLRGIRDPAIAPGTTQAVTIPAQSRIVLGKAIRLRSTGLLSAGSAMETKRVVNYIVPVGYIGSAANPKSEYTANWGNLARDWFMGDHTSHIGTQEMAASVDGGGPALHFTAAYTDPSGLNVDSGGCGGGVPAPSIAENTLGFNWAGAGVPLDQEWARAGHFLSYDLQAKMYIDLPNYDVYANGLLFRMDRQANCYGLSFAHRDTLTGIAGCDTQPDNINCSAYRYTPGLSLWRKTYPDQENFGTDKVVDVHGSYTDAPRYCTPSTYALNPDDLSIPSRAIISTLWLTNGAHVKFQTTGTLPTPLVSGEDYYVRKVQVSGVYYYYLFDTVAHAQKVWIDGTSCWTGLIQIQNTGSGTHTILAQKPIWTQLASKETREGWTSGSLQRDYLHLSPKTDSQDDRMRKWITVLVRVKEAPSITFTNGGDASLHRIKVGDIVYQGAVDSPTAIARVSREPVFAYPGSNKTWNGTAQGALILDVIKDSGGSVRPYTFSAGSLYVGGTALATVSAFRPKDNWIQVFVADPDDQTQSPFLKSPNTTPWDPNGVWWECNRKRVLRGEVYWPPDDVLSGGATTITTGNDYFTLVRMYVSDSATVTGFYAETNSSTGQPDMFRILETSSPFITPDSGTFPSDRPEVGLHAYGPSISSSYFDNFAIRFGESAMPAKPGFLQPIQY
ncbi:MAG: type II secretion system protein [Deltaproteobacteria bacterium]|nr:type II secretion system protein [Deltaproteobacteria bacterium]